MIKHPLLITIHHNFHATTKKSLCNRFRLRKLPNKIAPKQLFYERHTFAKSVLMKNAFIKALKVMEALHCILMST